MTTILWARRAVTAGGLACLAVLGAGCASGSSGSAGPVVTVIASPAHSASSSSAPAPATTVTVTQAAPGGGSGFTVPPGVSIPPGLNIPSGITLCATRDLKVYLGLSQGATGHIYQVIDFQNNSGHPCVLYGYPGVSVAGGTPVTQVGAAADEDPSTPRQLIVLEPSQIANALLSLVNAGFYDAGACQPKDTTYLQIYPPNQTTPTYVAYSFTTCSSGTIHNLKIAATRPGSGG